MTPAVPSTTSASLYPSILIEDEDKGYLPPLTGADYAEFDALSTAAA